MASRNIANMHLFLEMKTKFPYLPEDTLRNYVFLYAQDQAKCLSLLQQESENHFHHSHQFSDFRQTDNKTNDKITKSTEENFDSISNIINFNIPPEPNFKMAPNNFNFKDSDLHQFSNPPSSSPRTNRSTNVIHLSTKSTNFANLPQQESRSAPIIDDSERPFVNMFTSVPESSHVFQQIPRDPSYSNQMMFSTTKEHIIEPCGTSDNNFNQSFTNSNKTDSSKKHAVKLSITPMLPYQQQQMNVYSNTVCATASHSSRPGRHTTSVNFQLQPQYSDQLPLEISSVPTGMGRPCNYRDFGSHVQISVGAQGATFTALRLQRPPVAQNPNIDYSSNKVSSGKNYSSDYSESSSQNLNFKFDKFSSSSKRVKIPQINLNNHPEYFEQKENVSVSSVSDQRSSKDIGWFLDPNNKKELKHPPSHGYQTTPDYIQAVKSHQRSQLKIVQEELDKAKSIFSNLKSEVNRMEFELLKRKENIVSSSYGEVIKKLKAENRQLRLECNCLLLEYDMISKGQIPVGETNEDFYSNIFTGPNDGLALYSHSGQKASKKENPVKSEQILYDEDDEKNSWKCKKCTFVNHPALEKCEICEISKNSGYVEFKTNYSQTPP
ncbi:TGF-beta-activated kinase 1 and MAP3K7-binding protein 2 isoform X2 [Parasteatoda tepidariorum]|uniref:TGF-beta-activated kinase 1 and MAP3K7-binding protein 2 isoform X2 n=1 Tax=Parasteatoda tepidariorum TaxID=114398 RepID=UPI0039BC410F